MLKDWHVRVIGSFRSMGSNKKTYMYNIANGRKDKDILPASLSNMQSCYSISQHKFHLFISLSSFVTC